MHHADTFAVFVLDGSANLSSIFAVKHCCTCVTQCSGSFVDEGVIERGSICGKVDVYMHIQMLSPF